MRLLSSYVSKFIKLQKKIGFRGAVSYSARFTRAKLRGGDGGTFLSKSNPVEFYSFVFPRPFGANTDSSGVDICWVIPDFSIGSGGHLNIFRFVAAFEKRGFKCHINIDGVCQFQSAPEAKRCINENFIEVDAAVSIGRNELPPARATFATSWTTAYTVRDFVGTGKKYYFVQDFEPLFSPMGIDYVFADQTYKFDFKAITAGSWLSSKLSEEYSLETFPFEFSYDKQRYAPSNVTKFGPKRVLFYARPVTPRRATELGLLSLERFHRRHPDCEIVLVGWDMSSLDIPFPYVNAGVVSLDELPEIYSSCEVALVLSLTNLSLLPLEVMACGCVVVSNRGANVEWLLSDKNSILADPNPVDLADALELAVSNDQVRENMKKLGIEFARTTSWEVECGKVVDEVSRDLLAGPVQGRP